MMGFFGVFVDVWVEICVYKFCVLFSLIGIVVLVGVFIVVVVILEY